MYNQTEAVLTQYELEIRQITRGRGAYICDTSQGTRLLMSFCGSKERGELVKAYLLQLKEQGFDVEQIYQNQLSEAVTEDAMTGECFILKDYVEGTELNTTSIQEIAEGARLLAIYHRAASQVSKTFVKEWKLEPKSVASVFERHYKELVKVKNFIRAKKKKTEFERVYMEHYEQMRQIAERSIQILIKQEEQSPRCLICHGDYNQHNILNQKGIWKIVHFEGMTYTWAMCDLANYLRKMLEKNAWDITVGRTIIDAYNIIWGLDKEEYAQLYALLLFPEKFWKVTNHYMNSNKAWISEREIEKLKKAIELEPKRLKFTENLFSFVEESCILKT